MDRKVSTLILTVILMFAFVTPAFAQEPNNSGDQIKFGENFVLEAEQTYDGDLAILGGNATLEANSELDGDLAVLGGNFTAKAESVIDGDVIVFGGNVNIDGTVDGDLGAIGGNVNLSDTAIIKGDVGSLGGRVERAEGATVEGDVQNLGKFRDKHESRNDDDDDNRRDAFPNPPVAPSAPGFDRYDHSGGGSVFGWIGAIFGDIFWNVSLLIMLGIITWLVAAFMPEQMLNVRETLTSSAPLSFGLGLLTSIVAVVLIPVAFLLLITICLALVPIVAYIALGIATLFGWIVVGHVLGERLLIASGRPQPSLIFSSIVGVSILTLITNLPVIGLIDCIGFIGGVIGALIAMAGLGAVLLSRFGTRPYPLQGGPASPPRSGGPSGAAYTRTRVHWTDPAPDVSEEEQPASEEELRAKIREALAEADELEAARAKAEALRYANPQPEPEIEPEDEAEEPAAEDGDDAADQRSDRKKKLDDDDA